MEEQPQEPSVKTTVLIVSYNCADALRRCLERLEASDDRESFEILVVDCGSRDGCGQLDTEFENVTILRLPRQFGLTKARNIGTRTAKGDFLFLLDPDTEVAADTVSSLAARLEAESAAVAVCPLLVDDDGAPATRAGALPTPSALCDVWKMPDPWRQPIPGSPVPAEELEKETVEVECPDPRAVLVRTTAVRGMNYFDERYGHFGSNLEFAAQALRAGKHILLVPGVKAVTRGGEGLWQPESPAAEADLRGDFGTGVISYASKHFGFGASLKARLRLLAGSLIGLQLGVFSRLLGGAKIDGSQQGL